MSVLKEVTVSAAVGKQVFTSAQPQVVESVSLKAVSACTVTIRDGYASGDVVIEMIGASGTSIQHQFEGIRFDKGMHVKVIGTNGKCYLELN